MEPSLQPERLSALYNRLIDSQVERLLVALQPDGAFQANGAAYSIYDQNGMYPLALAYSRDGGPFAGDARLLDAIRRSGDRHARELNAQGQWEVVTPGGRWGWSFDEWRLHFWLETALRLGQTLGAERLAAWDEGIQKATEGMAALTRERLAQGLIDFVEGVCVTSPNHTAWYALVFRRAGERYGRPDWIALGDDLFARMREAQTPDGFWVEFAAPTVGYNYVSLLAVGVLWEHLGADASPAWRDCIERGMDAQLRWSYPDGGIVGEIEGRQRYHGPNNHALPAACAQWPRGAAALRATAERLRTRENDGHFLHSVAAAFLGETARYLARYDGATETPEPAIPVWKARAFAAGGRRRGPWQATLSGLVTPLYESRWRLDIGNRVGLYHADAGLLAGGGHSKHDPDWATVTLRPAPDSDPLWQPTGATLTQGGEVDTLRLAFDAAAARVDVTLTEAEATVRFSLEDPAPGATAVARLLRPLPPGGTVEASDGKSAPLDGEIPLRWTLEAGGEVAIGAARYALPPGGVFVWPRLPFNPYSQQDRADLREAFAAFEVFLDAAHPEATIRVRVARDRP